jgi:hypothetical protein
MCPSEAVASYATRPGVVTVSFNTVLAIDTDTLAVSFGALAARLIARIVGVNVAAASPIKYTTHAVTTCAGRHRAKNAFMTASAEDTPLEIHTTV